MSHISKTTIYVLDALVLLNVLAEWTVSLLDVSKLVLILQEELAAMLTHGNGDVWNHILEVLSTLVWTKLGVVHDEHLFVSHVLHDSLVNLDRLRAIWIYLGLKLLQHLLSEQVVFDIVILIVVKCQRLLLTIGVSILLPAILVSTGWLLCLCLCC